MSVRCSKGESIGSLLVNSTSKLDKVPVLEQGGVVYKQSCEDCGKVYIGETGRRAVVRKKEHDRDLRNLDMKSAIAEHSHSLDHRINFV